MSLDSFLQRNTWFRNNIKRDYFNIFLSSFHLHFDDENKHKTDNGKLVTRKWVICLYRLSRKIYYFLNCFCQENTYDVSIWTIFVIIQMISLSQYFSNIKQYISNRSQKLVLIDFKKNRNIMIQWGTSLLSIWFTTVTEMSSI